MNQLFTKFTVQKHTADLKQVVTIFKASELTNELIAECVKSDCMFSIETLDSLQDVQDEILVLSEYFNIDVTFIKKTCQFHIDCRKIAED